MFRTLFACLFLLVASLTAAPAFSLSPTELVAQATDARDSGNYRTAIRLYKQAADQGSAEAMNALGVMSMRGTGVPQDDKQAFFWIKKAADRGYPAAQKNFGILYAEGIWVKPNKTKAREWMQMAADNGNAEAQAWLDGTSASASRVGQSSLLQEADSSATSNSHTAFYASKWKECHEAMYLIATIGINAGLYDQNLGMLGLVQKYEQHRKHFSKHEYCERFLLGLPEAYPVFIAAICGWDVKKCRYFNSKKMTNLIDTLQTGLELTNEAFIYVLSTIQISGMSQIQKCSMGQILVSGHSRVVNGKNLKILPYCRSIPEY